MLILVRVIIACLMGATIGSVFRHFTHRTEKPAAVASVKPTEAKPVAKLAVPDLVQEDARPGDKKKQPEPVRVCGYVVHGRKVNVILSDGRTLTEMDPELKNIHRNSVMVGTEKLFMKQPKDRPPAAAAPAETPSADAVQPSAVESRPPPPSPPASAWVLHSDGVSRLVTGPVLGK